MTHGNGVRDDSQLRDIQELIARLDDVNRQLAQPTGLTGPQPALEPDATEAAGR